MRKFGLALASVSVILMSVAWVEGQQDEKKKRGGFGGIQFGGQRQQDPLTLLRNASVKKELDLTEEQLDKLPAEVLSAIAKVLNEKQMKRFREIELQQRGNSALKDEAVQKKLKVTDEQKKSINSILEDSTKETTELFKGGAGAGDFKGRFEKMETIRKETKEKLYGVLTSEQRKAWRGMVGEEFKIERQGFGGGTFGGTRKKKNNDQ